MKTPYYDKLLLLFLLLSGSLYFSSCIDDSVDLDNLSKDIRFDGGFEIPILKKSTVTMRDILAEYGGSTTGDAKFGSTDHDPQLVALFYEDEFEYSGDGQGINGGINFLNEILTGKGADLNVWVTGNSSKVTGKVFLNLLFIDDSDPHNIKKLELVDATISIKPIAGMVPKSVTIGGQTKELNSQWDFNLKDVVIEDDSEVILEFSSGDSAPSHIALNVKCKEYIVWGWFNYDNIDIIKEENFSSDITKDLTECDFDFIDPQFAFTVTNENLGLPLIFDLHSVYTNKGSTDEEKVTFNGTTGVKFDLSYQKEPDDLIIEDSIIINKEKDQEYNFDLEEYSKIVHSQLNNVSVAFDLITQDIDVYAEDTPMQFISSKGKIKVNTKILLPFWINKGILAYSVDIDAIEVPNLEEEYTDLSVDLNEASITISLTCENYLPIEVNAIADILNKNNEPIVLNGKNIVKEGKFEKGTVSTEGSTEGLVTDSKESTFDIKLTKEEYDALKGQEINLKLHLASDSTPTGTIVKVRTSDYLTLSAKIVIDGVADIKFK